MTFNDVAFVDAVAVLPVASTQNVADEVGCSYDLAYRRLKTLENEGRVKSETVRGSFVWLPVDE
jgi:DNA-binding transcriptional regulator YhcF (GntR family)